MEENPRRRESLKEAGFAEEMNGYADMKQRTKLNMLCSVF